LDGLLAGFPGPFNWLLDWVFSFDVDCILLIDMVERLDCAVPGLCFTLKARSRFCYSMRC
jgi:hypothetical protein